MATKEYYNLDIEDIKAEMVEYFEAQPEFAGYNFSGSGLSSLLNIGSFVTQYVSFFINQTVNDLTIINAERELQIKKLANTLNYLPNRKSAPYIFVNLSSLTGDTDPITIPKYSTWSLGSLVLTNVEEILIDDLTTQNVRLYEGTPTTETFISDGTVFQEYDLDYADEIDDDFFDVYVDPTDGGGGWTTDDTAWVNVNTGTFELNDNSYYLKYFEYLTVKFDNGNLFAIPQTDDQIRVEYVKTAGSTNNGATGTVLLTELGITNSEDLVIAATSNLDFGTDEETNAAIQARAPLFYTTQNRGVTEDDYDIIVKKWSKYDILDSAEVWGGEREFIDIADNDNLVETSSDRDLGYIYISTLLSDLDYIDSVNWGDLETYLTTLKYLAIFFKLMDPVFINISPTVNVKYNALTSGNEDVETTINTYLDSEGGFKKSFYLSGLVSYVNNLANVTYTDITYTSTFTARHDDTTDYRVIRLNAAVDTNSVVSVGNINGFPLADDGAGNMTWNSTTVGSINYTTGFIVLDTDFGGLADESTYEVTFEYTDLNTFTLEKESYLNYEDINYVLIT